MPVSEGLLSERELGEIAYWVKNDPWKLGPGDFEKLIAHFKTLEKELENLKNADSGRKTNKT